MNRDYVIIEHILRYCDEIDLAVNRFGRNRETFAKDPVYRNAVSIPVQQIGELAKHLSEDFIESHAEIPWKPIKGMRTWFAHQYLNMDVDVIWEVVIENIPELRAFCLDYLADNDLNSSEETKI